MEIFVLLLFVLFFFPSQLFEVLVTCGMFEVLCGKAIACLRIVGKTLANILPGYQGKARVAARLGL